MTSSVSPVATDPDREEPPFKLSLLEELLLQMDKTVRARQLYLANNPAYHTALEKLRAGFAPIWDATDSFTLHVTETQFRCYETVVHEQATKASDSLPWLFYKDGLREITLSSGFEGRELEALIDIIPKVRRAQADDDDLVTLLWEHEFEHLVYRYVEAGSDGTQALAAAAQPGRYEAGERGAVADPTAASAEARAEAAAGTETVRERSGVVKLEEFDSTLYFLEEREIEYIKQEVEGEYRTDLRRAVLDALCDIFELHADASVRTEVLRLLDQMILHSLSARQFQTVAYLLRESKTVVTRSVDLDPEHRERLLALPGRLSEAGTLAQLLQQLDDAVELPAQDDLNALFGELRAAALETVLGSLDQVRNSQLKALLQVAAERLASVNTGELVRIIAEGRGTAALEAVRRAGALKTGAAVAPLSRLLADTSPDLRRAAVTALVDIASPGAMQVLERALTDPDRDIRIIAVRALASRGQRSALPRIEAIVKSRELRSQDQQERRAFFEAFGELCGEGGIAFLDGILHGKSGLLGRREDPDIRVCAAMALGRVKSARGGAVAPEGDDRKGRGCSHCRNARIARRSEHDRAWRPPAPPVAGHAPRRNGRRRGTRAGNRRVRTRRRPGAHGRCRRCAPLGPVVPGREFRRADRAEPVVRDHSADRRRAKGTSNCARRASSCS